jgi:hypothetical protein
MTRVSAGSLEVGKLAELAVLSKNYMLVSVDQVGGIESVVTMVGGNSGVYGRSVQKVGAVGGQGFRLFIQAPSRSSAAERKLWPTKRRLLCQQNLKIRLVGDFSKEALRVELPQVPPWRGCCRRSLVHSREAMPFWIAFRKPA